MLKTHQWTSGGSSEDQVLVQSACNHSESHSQKLAKAKDSETVGDATKTKSGTLTAVEIVHQYSGW